ncbi:ABC transporter permease [Desulfococcus sp.]|uniref:ABC transporter permease n=1 Tax=Desulfococcus sp. TaxID=2025834 RepID=UPI003594056B
MNTIFIPQVKALAVNVWREATRDRLILMLVGSGVLMMLVSLVFGQMAVGGQARVLQDMGFWIIGIWGLIAVLYLGSGIIKHELQRKTVYLVLSRPVGRPTFLLGKYFGMILVLMTAFLLLSAAWLLIVISAGISLTGTHFWALGFIFGEWMLLSAMSLFFASFTSPMLHNFFLVSVSFLGHWSNELKIFADNAKTETLKFVLNTLYYLLPNLEAINFREAALYNDVVSQAVIWQGAVVLLGWTATALVAANLIFMHRRLL